MFSLYQTFPVNSQVLGWVYCAGNAGITCVMEETCGHGRLNPFLLPRNYVDSAGLLCSWTHLPAEYHKASISFFCSVQGLSVGILSTLYCNACSLFRNCFKKQWTVAKAPRQLYHADIPLLSMVKVPSVPRVSRHNWSHHSGYLQRSEALNPFLSVSIWKPVSSSRKQKQNPKQTKMQLFFKLKN